MPRQIAANAGEPYRPSNGTEGDIFMAAYCEKCAYEDHDNPCPILGNVFFLDIGDADYPKEWTHDAEGWPTCTAFEARASEPKPEPRCQNTLEMDLGDGRATRSAQTDDAT